MKPVFIELTNQDERYSPFYLNIFSIVELHPHNDSGTAINTTGQPIICAEKIQEVLAKIKSAS